MKTLMHGDDTHTEPVTLTKERATEIITKVYTQRLGGNVSRHLTAGEHKFVTRRMRQTRKGYMQVIIGIARPLP